MENVDLLDLNLKLISGKPVYIEGIPIYPITLNDICEISYKNYYGFLNFISINKDTLSSIFNVDSIDEKLVFGYSMMALSYDTKGFENIINFFELICKEKLTYDSSTFCLYCDKFKINGENYKAIVDVIKKRNCMEDIEEDMGNPANARVAELLARSKKYKEKINKLKKKENELDVSLADLISILASGMKMSIFDILKYDIFQFNNQFNRLAIFKNYDINIQALLAGANKDDMNIQHWMSRIKIEK